MELAAVLVIVIAALGVAIWLWSGQREKAKRAARNAKVSKKRTEAAAKAPRTKKGVQKNLDSGKF